MGTCENCEPKDGVEHDIDDPEYQTPNPTCLGGARCRCVNIYKVNWKKINFSFIYLP